MEGNIKYLEFVEEKVNIIEHSSFFDNIKKYPYINFLLGMYNYKSILAEHNLHMGVTLTKLLSEKHVKEVVKILYSNTSKYVQYDLENPEDPVDESQTNPLSLAEYFELFLKELNSINNSEVFTDAYIKKFSIITPADKMCNDLCTMILDKSWQYVIASHATFLYVNAVINKKLNEYAKSYKKTSKHRIILQDSYTNSIKLFNLLEGDDNETIKSAIVDTVNLFFNFINETDNIFYCD